jgi:hypothetical protein
MSVRASLWTCLIAAGLLSAAGAANGQDPSIAARATAASAGMDGCVRYVSGQAIVVRCALAEPQIVSDHGLTAGEPYDVQGNPVDRHGNVIAVPEGQGQGGRGQPAREVFANDRRTLR